MINTRNEANIILISISHRGMRTLHGTNTQYFQFRGKETTCLLQAQLPIHYSPNTEVSIEGYLYHIVVRAILMKFVKHTKCDSCSLVANRLVQCCESPGRKINCVAAAVICSLVCPWHRRFHSPIASEGVARVWNWTEMSGKRASAERDSIGNIIPNHSRRCLSSCNNLKR